MGNYDNSSDQSLKNTPENSSETLHTDPDLGYGAGRIVLPMPPALGEEMKFEMEIYARFMRHLRHVPNSRADIKVLSSIQFTADIVDYGDALVAKILVDLGLRAPRNAFPITFLDFVDKSAARQNWNGGMPPASIMGLREYWERIGENRFSPPLRLQYRTRNRTLCAVG